MTDLDLSALRAQMDANPYVTIHRSEAYALLDRIADLEAVEECDVKHCGKPPTLGTVLVYGELRIEAYLCERHFDQLDDQPTARALEGGDDG